MCLAGCTSKVKESNGFSIVVSIANIVSIPRLDLSLHVLGSVQYVGFTNCAVAVNEHT